MKRLWTVMLLLGLLACGSEVVRAGGCYPVSSYGPVYSSPVCSGPTLTSYSRPTNNYAPTTYEPTSYPLSFSAESKYYPTTYDYPSYHVKEIYVPILQPLPFFIDPRISYLYNGGNYINVPLVPQQLAAAATQTTPPPSQVQLPPQQPVKTEQPRTAANDIDAIIDRIEKRVRERQQIREPEGPPRVPGHERPPANTAATVTPVAPQRDAVAVLKANGCQQCHSANSTPNGPKGGFLIFVQGDQLDPSLDKQAVIKSIKEGRMPLKSSGFPQVSPADTSILEREWNLATARSY